MTIQSAKQTKKEYAERPFRPSSLIGKQITIEEKLGTSERPRIVSAVTKDGKGKYELVALKVSDGMFEKDLHLYESEWNDLTTCLPDSLLSLQGVNVKITRDSQTLFAKFEYVGVAKQNMQGEQYAPQYADMAKASVPAAAPTPRTLSDCGRQLAQAIEFNYQMGIKTDRATLEKMAEAIMPGRMTDLLMAARTEGWIYEKDGIFRGGE